MKVAGREYPFILVILLKMESWLRLKPNWSCNEDGGCLDIRITPALRLMGKWADLMHWYSSLRKELGLSYKDSKWKFLYALWNRQ